MPDLCGQPHYTWPETVCTEPAGHYRRETDPHAGPLIINGRQRGGCAWDEPDAPVAAPASGLRDTLATWLRTHALNDLEDPAVIDSLTATVTTATNPTPTTNGNHQ